MDKDNSLHPDMVIRGTQTGRYATDDAEQMEMPEKAKQVTKTLFSMGPALKKLFGPELEKCPNCRWINNFRQAGFLRRINTTSCHKCGMPRPEGGFVHVGRLEMSKLRGEAASRAED